MQLLSVNVGELQRVGNKKSPTGIVKKAQMGKVHVGRLGLAGDHIASRKHHGGPDQAVYIYTLPDYEFWRTELGELPVPGFFGENLLFSEVKSASVGIGQRFRVGEVLLEATASRIPCQTLAARVGDSQFVKKFRVARRPGLYARVIEEGQVQAGDPISREGERPPGTPTILDTFEFYYDRHPTPAQVERLLAAPVAERLRADLEKQKSKF